MQFTPYEIQETAKMFAQEHLDIRTVTMGLSLRDCAGPGLEATADRVYSKVCREAERLVPITDQLAREYGIPIINRRVSVTPMAVVAEACGTVDPTPLAYALDRAAHQVGVDFLGGYSALVHKGFTEGDRRLLASLPEALATTSRLCGSVNVGTTQAGINMDAVRDLGRIIHELAWRTAEAKGLGCAKLVVFANAVEDNPFMAGAFHGLGEGERVIHVGVSGPGVVQSAVERLPGAPLEDLAEAIARNSFQITRMGELIGREACRRLGVPFGIVDLSLAPTPAVGDSVARIFQSLGLESIGAAGSTAALALITDAVKKGGLMASRHVGGLSGAFIPVTEDEGMIEAVRLGRLSIEKLEAMTAVCSVGLDMVIVPGDTPPETLAGVIADEAAIGMMNHKTTGVRLIPAPGCHVGEMVEFGGLLGRGPVMPLSPLSSQDFIRRGGRLPAPVHSFRN